MNIYGLNNSLTVGSASVRGQAHVKQNLPNQDSWGVLAASDTIVAAVADGLGSCPQSQEGSSYAVKLTLTCILDYLQKPGISLMPSLNLENLKFRILRSWRAKFGSSYPDYDTTLSFVGFNSQRCVMGQLGDSPLFLLPRKEGEKVLVFKETPKTYQNVTLSLSHHDALSLLEVEEQEGCIEDLFAGFLLMTDGIADDLEDRDLFVRNLFSTLGGESAGHWDNILLKLLEDWPTPGTTDDKTIVVISLAECLPNEHVEEHSNQSRHLDGLRRRQGFKWLGRHA